MNYTNNHYKKISPTQSIGLIFYNSSSVNPLFKPGCTLTVDSYYNKAYEWQNEG